MKFVKDGGLFHGPNGFRIKGCSREIGQYQDRTKRTGNHKFGHSPENLFDLGRRTMRYVDEKNLLRLMSEKPKAVVKELARSGMPLGPGHFINRSLPCSLVILRKCRVVSHYPYGTPPTNAPGRTTGQRPERRRLRALDPPRAADISAVLTSGFSLAAANSIPINEFSS